MKLTFTVEEAAELLGISRGAAYEGIRAGELPSVRIGRRILVPRARLLALLGESVVPDAVKGGEPIEEDDGPGATVSATRRGDVSLALDS